MSSRWHWVRLTATVVGACSLAACGWVGGGKSSSALVFPANGNPAAGAWDATGLVPGGAAGAAAGTAPESAPINPFDPIALNNQAVVEASRGRYQQALTLLQRAVKLAPARPDIAANLSSMQRWLAQAEGQAALGLAPQPLQVPQQASTVQPVPPLWTPSARPVAPSRAPANPAPVAAPPSGGVSGAVAPLPASTAATPASPPVLAQPAAQSARSSVKKRSNGTYSRRTWRSGTRSTRPPVAPPVNSGPQYIPQAR